MGTERIEANGIDAEGFRRTAAAIAAEPEGFNQEFGYSAQAAAEKCGSACCVMGHAALILGAQLGFGGEQIEQRQRELACRLLGLPNRLPGAADTLFGPAWPVSWFLGSGAATEKQLLSGRRIKRDNDGSLQLAEPKAAEAVTVLEWIADLGSLPES